MRKVTLMLLLPLAGCVTAPPAVDLNPPQTLSWSYNKGEMDVSMTAKELLYNVVDKLLYKDPGEVRCMVYMTIKNNSSKDYSGGYAEGMFVSADKGSYVNHFEFDKGLVAGGEVTIWGKTWIYGGCPKVVRGTMGMHPR